MPDMKPFEKTILGSLNIYLINPVKIIQKRYDDSVNFQRTWTERENVFGNVNGEYWLDTKIWFASLAVPFGDVVYRAQKCIYDPGNKHIQRLTSSGTYELRIDLTDKNNNKKYAKYKTFAVGDATSQYKLTIGGYSGNVGKTFVIRDATSQYKLSIWGYSGDESKTIVVRDATSQYKLSIWGYSGNSGDSLAYSNGIQFSTVERDNDLHSSNCAKTLGPLWFKECSYSALNSPSKDKWYWHHISGHYVKTSVMMIRKV